MTKSKRNPTLEKEFENLYKTVGEEIKRKMADAEKLIKQAEALSEEAGIPFYSEVSACSQHYIPESFYTKFKELMNIKSGEYSTYIEELTGIYEGSVPGYGGWEQSRVCG